jgi:HEAT repeat protein
VAPLLRSADAGLRGGAIESLKRLEEDSVATLDALLRDPDPDVRLLAIEVTRGWPGALAGPRLRRIIESDIHVNVCGAAVDVATEVGAEDLVDALIALRERFSAEPFLVFAVDVALSRIHAADEPGA